MELKGTHFYLMKIPKFWSVEYFGKKLKFSNSANFNFPEKLFFFYIFSSKINKLNNDITQRKIDVNIYEKY